ncbi:MAG TPA: sulfatase-like hydrolase/transferase, partial [Polyangiaceae bacterium]|nr:sulfatase-like hydrolase/transferase [Polyangiaceae bacterium]
DDPEAAERFRKLSKLPVLPASFELARYNVLLLLSDSTRFDQTSLEQREIGSTPHLAALVDQGAFSFSRAFSPSSATFQAVSALLGMSHPSMLELETWNKQWKGRLHDSVLTAPELFRQGGYDTFWVSHDFGYCFSSFMLGLDSRFARRAVVYGDMYDKTVDRKIGDAAIGALEARMTSPSPFFGVVFLGSPHSPYLVQRPTRPEHTELERYRQEIREVDEQVGRILRVLFTSQLGPRTIVIYMGDHGEEFEEHGGHYHGGALYSESIHVPLVVWLPGMQGRRINEPTSTAYVLPWLLSHGPPQVREALNQHLRRTLGPMLRATDGAVVSEMLGHDLVKSTLIYPDKKFIYDFLSERHEAYRLDQDPGEQVDRFHVDAALSTEARARVAAYREVRAARRQFLLRPDILDPHDSAL